MPPLVDPAIEMKEILGQYSEYYPRYDESYYMTYLRVLEHLLQCQFKMKLRNKIDYMYSQRSYIHWYIREGIE